MMILCAKVSSAQSQLPNSLELTKDNEINVNWLYGSYIPKEVPLKSLNGDERLKLYIRQTYTTWGVYLKSTLFALSDQAHDRYPEWGDGFEGFAKRLGTRQAEFILQNSVISLGDGLVGWEPRYDRCRCGGFWPRTRHAVVRNFVTYDRTETKIRPQIPLYAAAFGAGVVAGTWTPNHDLLTTGGEGALTQVGFGILANVVGEFWPQIERVWKRKKPSTSGSQKN